MKKKKLFTFISSAFYLFSILPYVLLEIFGLIASLTEFPSNRSGLLYTVSVFISIILIILIPLIIIICNIGSISMQIVAIVRKEILWLNILLIVLSVAFIILSFLFAREFWIGAMSV